MAIVCTIMFVVCYRNVISESRVTALRNKIHDHKKNHINNNNDNNNNDNNNNNDDNSTTTQNLRTFFDDFTQHNALKATVVLHSVNHPLSRALLVPEKVANKICSKKYSQTRKCNIIKASRQSDQ